jgi:hypothetical protein
MISLNKRHQGPSAPGRGYENRDEGLTHHAMRYSIDPGNNATHPFPTAEKLKATETLDLELTLPFTSAGTRG